MPNYVTQMSKDSGGAYLVKDTAARQQISDEVTARETAVAAAATAEAAAREAAIANLNSALSDTTGNGLINFTLGKYIDASDSTVNINNPISNSQWKYAVVDASEGDAFTVNSAGGSSSRAWCWIDSSGNVLSVAGNNDSAENKLIKAPANTSKLVINAKISDGNSYYGEYIANVVADIRFGVNHGVGIKDIVHFSLIHDEYIKTDGEVAQYDGWSRSPFIHCNAVKKLIILNENDSTINYTAFYTSSKSLISRVNIFAGENEIAVPFNAEYFAFSAETTMMRKVTIKLPYIDELYEALYSGSYFPELIQNEYVRMDGVFVPYNGWSRTDKLDCAGLEYIVIFNQSDEPITYTGFYRTDNTFDSHFDVFHGLNYVPVPAGCTKYVLSGADDDISNVSVGIKTVWNTVGLQQKEEHNIATLYARKQIPSYFFDDVNVGTVNQNQYIDSKLSKLPSGKRFIFVTDPHVPRNRGNSIYLIDYCRKTAGITNVICGGDILDRDSSKFTAISRIRKYGNEQRSAFGDCFIPVMGNHDLNVANWSQEVSTKEEAINTLLVPYSVVHDAFLEKLGGKVICDKGNNLSNYASGDTLKELQDAMALHYYFDDEVQGIRHIVLDSGNPIAGAVETVFGDIVENAGMLRLQYDWLYNTLMSTPAGYDVVIAIHEIKRVFNNGSVVSTPDKGILILAYGAFHKDEAARVYFNTEVAASYPVMAQYYSAGTHTYDFSNCKCRKVIIVAGHDHVDWAANVVGSTWDTVTYSELSSGDTVSGVPVILTQCDALENIYEGQHPMQAETVTEQCFDIYTLRPTRIEITRIGAGNNRSFIWG